jgi:hypothetical protein
MRSLTDPALTLGGGICLAVTERFYVRRWRRLPDDETDGRHQALSIWDVREQVTPTFPPPLMARSECDS